MVALEPEEVSQLDEWTRAAYDRQKAAVHKEVFDMARDAFASTLPELIVMFPPDLLEFLVNAMRMTAVVVLYTCDYMLLPVVYFGS